MAARDGVGGALRRPWTVGAGAVLDGGTEWWPEDGGYRGGARHGGKALAGGLGWPGRRLTAWATRDMQGERTGERCTGERDGEQDASSFFAQQGGGNTKQDS